MFGSLGMSGQVALRKQREIVAVSWTSRTHKMAMLTGASLFLVALVLASPSTAFGYADPGTGAFVYQSVYAGFLVGAFYIRKILNRTWGKRKKSDEPEIEPQPRPQTQPTEPLT